MEQNLHRLSPVILFVLSIGLQITAAVFALLLLRTTGRKLAWILLSLAMVLMAWRRIVSFVTLLAAGEPITFEFPEYIALTISALMMMGVILIGAYFRSVRIAEQALRESEARYRHLFEANPHPMWVYDLETLAFLAVNDAAVAHYGYSREEFLTMSILDLHPAGKLFELTETVRQVPGPLRRVGVWPQRWKDGTLREVEITTHDLNFYERNARLVLANDITERKRAEEKLRTSESELRKAQKVANVGNWVWHIKTGRLEWSDQMYRIFGIDKSDFHGDLAGVIARAVHPDDRAKVEHSNLSVLRDKKPIPLEYRVVWPDGTVRVVWAEAGELVMDEQGEPAVLTGIVQDITEQRKLEAQYLQAQKMESIGTLAGGVAHDFNNILSAIIGYGHVALMKMAENDPQRVNIEHMLEGADRAAHLTKDLLLFSRKQVSERKPVDLNKIVSQVEKLLKRVIGEDITCNKAVTDHPLMVFGDSHQIEQVLMNLAANARDAMPEGGAFTVQTEEVALHEDFMAAHGYGKPGPYAMITVSDTGTGMDEATRKSIFEPFFTTKEVGKGTGLGLSVVYGIIKQHDGFINVYSEPGKGTTFRVYLPIITSAAREGTSALQEEAPARGTETVLLAEDDETLRKLSRTVLVEYGYTVIEAVDGEDAVRKFMENKESIQILLIDLIMPKMNGKEACDEIRKIKPNVKVIFSSGYAPDSVQQKELIEEGISLTSKPMSPVGLLRKLRSMLDGTTT